MTGFIQRLWQAPSPLRPLRLDWPLLGGCLALMALSLVMITSASANIALKAGSPYYFLNRQCLHLLAGALAGLFFLLVPLRLWQSRQMGWLLLGLSIILLALLLVVATPVKGAQRWFDIGTFKVQPTEPIKLFVIIYLAGYLLHRRRNLRTSWKGVLIPLACLLPLGFLLHWQPDFGSILILFAVAGGMLFLAGLSFRHLLVLAVLAGLLVACLLVFEPYRWERLINSFDVWTNRYDGGYQVVQSLMAFGRGGWFGVGLGGSVQKHAYLPEAHTDFILAVLAEELGFVGVLACLGLFALVCLRALFIGVCAERAGLPFSAYLAYGIALLWMAQVLINFAVNLGLAPTKGLALPFVSYGGSALILCCASLGLLLRIDWEYRQLPQLPPTRQDDESLPDWLQGLRYE